MRTQDIIREGYIALTMNKVRSTLTILGIVIGIASVIAMIGIGQGAQESISSQFESLGSNMLVISPGQEGGMRAMVRGARGGGSTLTEDDIQAIEGTLSDAKAVAGIVSTQKQVIAGNTNTNTSITGTTPAYQSVRSLTMESGIFLSDRNVRSRSKVAVLGPTTRDDLYGEGVDPVGEKIRIGNVKFTIVGVTASKGGDGFMNQDDVIFVPLSTAQQYLVGGNTVNSIYVEAVNEDSMSQLATDITDLLLAEHGITNPDEADFSVTNQSDIIEAVSSVSQTLTLLLGAIAGISLVVGGIGIMNMMLTTVTERTREIGLRKAIGAKSRDISLQFLIESIMLTLLGGIIGIAVGWGAAYGVSVMMDTPTSVTTFSVMLAFSVSVLIGVVFGYYPARKASKLNPIDALRYE